MHRLIPGIKKFHCKVFPSRRAKFEQLAHGQKPSTLFITCSDSRIVPEMLTQTEPGELFVLRNAGNLVPPYDSAFSGEAATIEYAVKALEVQEIVVCGHSHCGAITGVLRPELVGDLPAVEKWLVHAQKLREEIFDQPMAADGGDDALTKAIKANVLVQLRHLRAYPVIADAEAEGKLSLNGWFYRFETGDVSMFDSTTNQYASVMNDSFGDSQIA
jgi:carbonic anhydrase